MEELIEILIRLIAGLFENKAVKQPPRSKTPPGYQGAPAQPGRIEPPSRAAITRKMPAARRPGRRPAPQSVAVAQPIVTTLASPASVATQPVAVARAAPAKPIATGNPIPTLSAASIRKWMSPATLKQQFLLTEILQPPLSLRDSNENHQLHG
jgi:hypothetical protein